MNSKSPVFFNKSNRIIHNILIVNVLLFLLINIVVSYSTSNGINPLDYLKNLGLNSNFYNFIKRPWTLFTNMFAHAELLHLLFNMLYFWFFAKILREKYGSQAVLSSYVIGGLFGGIFYMIFYPILSGNFSDSLLIGASGSVMSIMVASAIIVPDKKINLLFIGSIKLKWIVITLFILTTLINFNDNMGGKIDHIGGAFWGFSYAFFLRKRMNIAWLFDSFCFWISNNFKFKKTIKKEDKIHYTFRGSKDRRDFLSRETSIKNVLNKRDAEIEIDKLLDKIKLVGYDNLSNKEKDTLKKLSEKY